MASKSEEHIAAWKLAVTKGETLDSFDDWVLANVPDWPVKPHISTNEPEEIEFTVLLKRKYERLQHAKLKVKAMSPGDAEDMVRYMMPRGGVDFKDTYAHSFSPIEWTISTLKFPTVTWKDDQ